MNKRTANLLSSNGPKYVRCYDNGGTSADRYTVVYTGRYRGKGWFQYVGMSANPFHPQGVGMHGEHPQQIDVNKWGFAPAMGRKCHLGKRIPFAELPADCQKLVLSDYRAIWELPNPFDTLKEKMNPKRFTAMSPRMASIVAYILGESWVTPQVSGLMVTSDKFVLASVKGDCGYNHFIGAESDLQSNWNRLLGCAGLGLDERTTADKLFAEKVRHA